MKTTVEIELHSSEEVPRRSYLNNCPIDGILPMSETIIIINEYGQTSTGRYDFKLKSWEDDGLQTGMTDDSFLSDFKWYYPPITKQMAFKD